MKIIVPIELSEAQLRLAYRRITGGNGKQRATREMIREFVHGCVESLVNVDSPTPVFQQSRHQLSMEEIKEVERLRALGKDDSYIRGWIRVGRTL